MITLLIWMNPKALHPKQEEIEFNPHDMRELKSDAYCNLCLKKGVMYVCASVDHDRIHRPIGGFHLCETCHKKIYNPE
jgi:hypothetical protein